MNFLEQFAINMILGLLGQVIKNPTLKVEVQDQLVGIGTTILTEYGYTVTAPATGAATLPAAATPAKVTNPHPQTSVRAIGSSQPAGFP
jgi:hypothetical protein